ncbi:MAG: nitroreductase/quinone reductase family protein [Actinomycetota bacterium]
MTNLNLPAAASPECVSPEWEQHEYCYLTTLGRTTGHRHRIEIWFTVHAKAVWLLTEPERLTHWVRNIRVNPSVTLEVGDLSMPAIATLEPELPVDSLLREHFYQRYSQTYREEDDLLAWCRGALAVLVTPQGGQHATPD